MDGLRGGGTTATLCRNLWGRMLAVPVKWKQSEKIYLLPGRSTVRVYYQKNGDEMRDDDRRWGERNNKVRTCSTAGIDSVGQGKCPGGRWS